MASAHVSEAKVVLLNLLSRVGSKGRWLEGWVFSSRGWRPQPCLSQPSVRLNQLKIAAFIRIASITISGRPIANNISFF